MSSTGKRKESEIEACPTVTLASIEREISATLEILRKLEDKRAYAKANKKYRFYYDMTKDELLETRRDCSVMLERIDSVILERFPEAQSELNRGEC